MRINGYQCDSCKKLYNNSSLPQGWVEIDQILEENERIFFQFCSIGCLTAWAITQKTNEPTNSDRMPSIKRFYGW